MTTENDNNDVPEMVTFTNPKTGQAIQVTSEAKEALNAAISIARKDATTKVEAKYKPIQDTLSTLQPENDNLKDTIQQLQDSQLDESGKLQKQYERNTEALNKQIKDLTDVGNSWKSKYENTKIMTDVYGAFGEYKLSNPEHAAILFMNSVQTNIEEKIDGSGNGTGEHQTMMKMVISDGNGGFKEAEGSPKELFKHWIEQDSNKHLLANNLNPGSGSNHDGSLNSGSTLDKLRAEYDKAKASGDGVKAFQLKERINSEKAKQV